MSGAHAHDYHLVDPSPWPGVGATAALCLTVGAVLYFHGYGPILMAIGFVLMLATMFFWWRDVIKEAEFEGHHSPVVQLGHRYGMALFIASEVMFFSAFFWAFFNSSLFPTEQMGNIWPPDGVEPFNPWEIPFLNTIILLSSGVTVTFCHHELRKENRTKAIMWMWATLALGVAFTGFQAYEYVHATFTMDGGIYGSTFYMATGFHGFHVIIGTCFLAVCQYRLYAGHFKPDHHFGFEAAAWYWHFVDVVWLFLFSCIYWWGSGSYFAGT